MFVTTEDMDRTILRYEVPIVKDGQIEKSGTELILVHDIEVTGDYMVLHGGRLMWKGNIATCVEKFADEIESWERDMMIDLEKS